MKGAGLHPLRRLVATISISAAIIQACFELEIEAAPGGQAFGHRGARPRPRIISSAIRTVFNTVHGRMPSVLTGANLANRDLIYLGVSGDGDSASIGFSDSFAHSIRRGVQHDLYRREQRGLRPDQGASSRPPRTRGPSPRKAWSTTTAPSTWWGWPCSSARTFVGPQLLRRQGSALVPPGVKAAPDPPKAPAFIDCISPCIQFQQPRRPRPRGFDYVRASITRR